MLTTRIPTPTAASTAAESPLRLGTPAWLLHAGALLWITGLLVLARVAPLEYNALVQEDRFIEWWTVTLFAAAAIVRIRAAWPERRIFDLLVAAFCVFVAGEEFSWGQRLFGFTPPASFLEHNTQQELTLHNFADVFGRPKFTLIAVLIGYGIVLPLFAQWRTGKSWLNRIGATIPPRSTVIWLVAAILLLVIYPVDFTGEWVEALVGALFFVAARPAPRTVLWGGLLTIVVALGLTAFSARALASDSAAVVCARAQADALVRDLTTGTATTNELIDHTGSVHKRVYTAVQDGYIDANALTAFHAVQCGKAQRFFLDPWGMAYWVRVSRDQGEGRSMSVYSMGPNRKRDHSPTSSAEDDIIADQSVRWVR
jgi:hypothetical protein